MEEGSGPLEWSTNLCVLKTAQNAQFRFFYPRFAKTTENCFVLCSLFLSHRHVDTAIGVCTKHGVD